MRLVLFMLAVDKSLGLVLAVLCFFPVIGDSVLHFFMHEQQAKKIGDCH